MRSSSFAAARRRVCTIHGSVAVLLAALVGWVFRPWLEPYQQPQRGGPELAHRFRAGDLTPLFSVWTQLTQRSLLQRGKLPLWSDHIYCGEPFFAKPQVGVLSLTTLLCVGLPAQVAATWTFLLHLWIAGMSFYAWGLDVLRGVRRPGFESRTGGSDDVLELPTALAAACGGVSFMLSGLMAEHAMMGHGPIVLVACWTPLVLRSAVRAFAGERPIRHATAAGVLVAVQLLAGGETMFLYNAIAGGLVGLAWVLCGRAAPRAESRTQHPSQPQAARGSSSDPGGLPRRLLRVVAVATVIGLVGFGLSAVKVLPGLELMPITNRAGGLPLDDAALPINEFREPAVLRAATDGLGELGDAGSLFPVTLLLAAAGMFAALRRADRRWLLLASFFMLAAGLMIAHSRAVFAALWEVLPLFRYQRIPQRALVLAYLGAGTLVVLGAQRLLDAARRRPAVVPAGIGVALVVGVFAESLAALPPLSPTADIRREIRANELVNHVAAEPGRFRIHAWESTDRNWGIEHVTVPLGLSNLAGWDHLWLRDYLGAEGTVGRDVLPFLTASYRARHRERFWGLMNVRFVSAMQPLDRPALKLIRQFPPCPECQPAKSAGPYLYENTEWLPRAWVVPRCVFVAGAPASYQLLDHPRFDPRRLVILHDEQHGLGHHRSHDAFVIGSSSNFAIEEQREKARARNEWILSYSMQTPGLWQQPDEVDEMLEDLMSRDPEPEPPVIEPYRQGFVRVRLSGQVGFLVLAEKFAHFPGWQVRTASGPRLLLRANGVASAITLDGTEQWVEMSYRPRSFTAGTAITLLSILLALMLAWRTDRWMKRFSTGRVQP